MKTLPRLFVLVSAALGAAVFPLRAADAPAMVLTSTGAPAHPVWLTKGDVAPEFTVLGAKGETVKLSDFAGKVVIVDVSATWCGPCQAAMPNNDRVYRKYADQGVVLLGVTADDTRAAYDGWVKRNSGKYAFTMVFDPAGREGWKDSVFNTGYHVSGFPTLFVIGRDGKIAEIVGGGGPGEDYRLEYALARAGVKVDLASLPPEPKRDPAAPQTVAISGKTHAVTPPTVRFGTAKYGEALADFAAVGADGREVKLSAFKGKPVLITFWTGARAPGDDIAKLHATYKDQGLAVWAINVATDRTEFDTWAKANAAALGYSVAWDPAGKAFMESIPNIQFGVGMFPASIAVNAEGAFCGGIIGMGPKVAAWVRQSLDRAGIKLDAPDTAAVKQVMNELFTAANAAGEAKPMAMGGGLLPAEKSAPRPGFREAYGKLKAGDPVPDFTVITPEGKEAKFSDYAKGKTVILDFWATWCGPCQKAMPHYQELHQKYGAKGVVVLGICGFDTRANYEKWVKDHHADYTFATAFDPVGKPAAGDKDALARTVMSQVSGGSALTPLPTTLVVNPAGKFVGFYAGYGPNTHDTLANLLMLAGFDLASEDKPKVFFPRGSSLKAATAMGAAAPAAPELLKAGAVAPDFVMQDVAGHELKLSDFKGKLVILDFWATWCGPCLASLPHTQAIAAKYQDQGVVVVASGTSDTIENFKKWIPANQAKYPNLHFVFDPHARGTPTFDERASSRLYHVSGIPTQFVIGRDGVILAGLVGFGGNDDAKAEAALARGGLKVDPAIVAAGEKQLQEAAEAAAAAAEAAKEAAKHPRPPFMENYAKRVAGEPVPDFVAEDATGKPVHFSELTKGKVVVLSFWSAGNGLDDESLAFNEAWSRRYADQGVMFVGVGAYGARAAYDGWRATNAGKYTFPVLFDPAGAPPSPGKDPATLTAEEKKDLKARTRAHFDKVIPMAFTGGAMAPVPNNFVIDAQGRMRGIFFGSGKRSSEALANLLLRAGVKLTAEDQPAKVWTAAETKPPVPEAQVAMLKPGAKAPDFKATAADGKDVKLSDFRGKVVILDFWATWCGPCLASMPHTQEVAAHYQDQGVVVVASCTSDSRRAFESWVKRNAEKYPNIHFSHDAEEKSANRASHRLYGVGGIPQQFIIDREGTIVALVTGYLKGEAILDAALAKAGIKVDPALIAKGARDLEKRSE